MRRFLRPFPVAFPVRVAATLAMLVLPYGAFADVTHVVQPGHTLQAIAHRYHVSEAAIVDANHLKDKAHLKPGQTLVIPGVDARADDASDRAAHGHRATSRATAALERAAEPRGRHVKGVVEMMRGGEELRVRVKDPRGRVPAGALDGFERMMRQGAGTHPPDPRLVALIGIVSDHFGGKPIDVVSGYRAYTPTQYTAHSNHNYGRALDFHVDGVKNESVYAFCLTLRNTGCGYYPNSSFVHLDVRDVKTHWIDRSHAGEPPQYDRPGVAADEGRSDVPEERVAPSPTEAPSLPPVPPADTPAGSSKTAPSPAMTDSEKSL